MVISRRWRFNGEAKAHSGCVDWIPKSLQQASFAGSEAIARIRCGVVAAAATDMHTGAMDKNLYRMEGSIPFTMRGIKIKQGAGLAVCGRLSERAGNLVTGL